VIREGLQVYLKDNVNAWDLGSDGHYRRRKPRGSQTPYSAQQYLMETLGLNMEMSEHGIDPVATRRS
jgi:polyphosphate kinase